MTKEELFDTIQGIVQDDDKFWEYISKKPHPTKWEGQVYNKIKELTRVSHDDEMTKLVDELRSRIFFKLGWGQHTNHMALTEKGVQFFNQLHRFLLNPSNP